MHPCDALGEGCLASEWHLWDGRYWLRILDTSEFQKPGGLSRVWYGYKPRPQRHFVVRFPTKKDIADTRQSLSGVLCNHFNQALRPGSGDLRYTVPAIFEQRADDFGTLLDEVLVALPSLGWSRDGEWARWRGLPQADEQRIPEITRFWEVRYRSIDYKASSKHEIVASDGERNGSGFGLEGMALLLSLIHI